MKLPNFLPFSLLIALSCNTSPAPEAESATDTPASSSTAVPSTASGSRSTSETSSMTQAGSATSSSSGETATETGETGPGARCGTVLTGCPESPLAVAAASLAQGEWLELGTEGFDGGGVLDVDNGGLFGFADEGVWNPNTQAMVYLGAAAGGGPENSAYVCYDACSNDWTRLPLQEFSDFPVTHSYDTLAMFPEDGRFFYYRFGRRDMYAYDTTTGMPPVKLLVDHEIWENPVSGARTPAITYFPEMDGLIVYQGVTGRVWLVARSGEEATLLGTAGGPSTYHQFGKYDPVRARVWFGGGENTRQIWWVDARGTIEELTESPVGLGLNRAVQVLDPASGQLLVFSEDDGGTFRAYNADTATWSTEEGASVPFLASYNGHGVIATALSEHCAILFVTEASVWLYRH